MSAGLRFSVDGFVRVVSADNLFFGQVGRVTVAWNGDLMEGVNHYRVVFEGMPRSFVFAERVLAHAEEGDE